jgi:hypothetical protein
MKDYVAQTAMLSSLIPLGYVTTQALSYQLTLITILECNIPSLEKISLVVFQMPCQTVGEELC